MDDLKQRLRAEKSVIGNTRTFPSCDERDMVLVPIYGPNQLAQEAAAALDAKDAEIARLRDALAEIAEYDTGATAGLAHTALAALSATTQE